MFGNILGYETLDGGDGDDSPEAGNSRDTLADSIVGGAGNDTVVLRSLGQYDTDRLLLQPFSRTIIDLGVGDDVVMTTQFYMNFWFPGLNVYASSLDTIHGGDGNDHVSAGSISDFIYGGEGDDTLYGDYAFRTDDEQGLAFLHGDLIRGEDGNDSLSGGDGVDEIDGGAGDDTVRGDNGFEQGFGDTLAGGTGNDLLSYDGSTSGVRVSLRTLTALGADAQADQIADDFEGLLGSAFGDSLEGNALANTIEGGAVADTLSGGEGRDLLSYLGDTIGVSVSLEARTASGGDAAGDSLAGDFEDLLGSSGNDWLEGRAAASLLMGGAGGDTLVGGAGNDTFEGGAGADSLVGGGGADVMRGGAGDDRYWVDEAGDIVGEAGGSGLDRIYTTLDWILGDRFEVVILAGAQRRSIEGNALDNRLLDNRGANLIEGGEGRDVLVGGASADTLVGGAGSDKLTGGAGNDRFLFGAPGDQTDRIMDFTPGQDRIAIDASGFGRLLTPGLLPVLTLGTAAAGAGAQFVYDSATGRLSWDANGAAALGAVLIAVLDTKPLLAAADFVVVA